MYSMYIRMYVHKYALYLLYSITYVCTVLCVSIHLCTHMYIVTYAFSGDRLFCFYLLFSAGNFIRIFSSLMAKEDGDWRS